MDHKTRKAIDLYKEISRLNNGTATPSVGNNVIKPAQMDWVNDDPAPDVCVISNIHEHTREQVFSDIKELGRLGVDLHGATIQFITISTPPAPEVAPISHPESAQELLLRYQRGVTALAKLRQIIAMSHG